MRKKLLISLWALVGVTAGSLFLTQNGTQQALVVGGDIAQDKGEGKALIGGAFTLSNQDGAIISDMQLRGRPMLVFFGFTHCPDICPVTASIYASVLQELGDKASQFSPVFISVDPQRDTPDVLKQYFAKIDSRIIALTGTPEQIKQAAAAYKAFYSTAQTPAPDASDHSAHGDHSAHASAAPAPQEAAGGEHADHGAHAAPADSGNYMVDHSGFIYLMDKDGNYVRHFQYNASPKELIDALLPLLPGA
jgi:cytochrome oxidase Cu insertion factor (SCO1/SenC/PrrC family)